MICSALRKSAFPLFRPHRHQAWDDQGLGMRYQEVRGVTVSRAGERVPPYTVNELP